MSFQSGQTKLSVSYILNTGVSRAGIHCTINYRF